MIFSREVMFVDVFMMQEKPKEVYFVDSVSIYHKQSSIYHTHAS